MTKEKLAGGSLGCQFFFSPLLISLRKENHLEQFQTSWRNFVAEILQNPCMASWNTDSWRGGLPLP